LPPHGFELRLADFKRRDHGVVADIVGDQVQCAPLACLVQQRDHISFTRCVAYDCFSAAAGVLDFGGDGCKARRGAARDDDPQALFGKAARERGIKPGRRSNAHHDGRLFAQHINPSSGYARCCTHTSKQPAIWSRQGEEASANGGRADMPK
jgi:hypothetical protein